MLIWNQVRGFDSTGVAAVAKHASKNDREIRLAKEVGPPTYLMDTKSFDKCFYGTNQVFIGHNRSKTQGDATRKNAHPFLFEDIVGAHNGTISMASKNRLDGGSTFKTDSEAIFNNIQLHGVQDTISRIDRGGDNSYALTWYDGRDNTFNILRNEHRPLLYLYSKSHRTMYWSSLYWTLLGAIDLEGVERAAKPYEPTEDTWYRWVLPKDSWDILPEPIREKVENRKPITSSFFPDKKNTGYGKSSDTKYSPDFHWPDVDDNAAWEGMSSVYQPADSSVSGADSTSKSSNGKSVTEGEDAGEEPPFDIESASGERQEIIEGMKRIQGAYEALSDPVVTNVKETSTSVEAQSVPHIKYEQMKTLGLIKKERFPQVYESKALIVHRDIDTNEWTYLRWDPLRLEWDRFTSKQPPVDLPFTILDVNARHQFHHTGKGKHKKISYKGFRGSLLDQDQFTKVMQKGCSGCKKVPEWGNLVHFINSNQEYLCEYCGLWDNGNLIKELIESGKEKKVG